jgi:uncharacterized repeat protein (TIGR03803 family)
MTPQGATNGIGSIYRITPNGNLSTLYQFAGPDINGPDGAHPIAQLVQGFDGSLYRVT